MQPKLSVIIPTCNQAHLLERALVRYSKQKFSLDELELVVIDDWSLDWTDKLLRHWSNRLNLIAIRPGYRDPMTERSETEYDLLGDRVATGEIRVVIYPQLLVGNETLNFLYQHPEFMFNNIYLLSREQQLHLDDFDWEEDLSCIHGQLNHTLCVSQNMDCETLENPFFKPIKDKAIA